MKTILVLGWVLLSASAFAQLEDLEFPFDYERIHFPNSLICGIETKWSNRLFTIADQAIINQAYDYLHPVYQEVFTIRYEDKIGLINITTEKCLIPIQYDKIDFSRVNKKPSRYTLKLNNKYGLADTLHNILLPLNYEYLWINEAIDIVISKDSIGWQIRDLDGQLVVNNYFEDIKRSYYLPIAVKKTGKWGYINRQGETIFPFIYKKTSGFNMMVKSGAGYIPGYYPPSAPPPNISLLASVTEKGLRKLIHPDGNLYTPPSLFLERNGKRLDFSQEEWSNIHPKYLNGNYTEPSYKMELLPNERDSFLLQAKYDIDLDGSTAINVVEYTLITAKDSDREYINGNIYYLTGKQAIEENQKAGYYKKIQYNTYEPSTIRWVYNGTFFGLINRHGEVVLPIIYEKIGYQREGLIGIQKDGKVGFINEKGEVIIPFQFDDDGSRVFIYEFHQGRSIAYQNRKYGFIDTQGKAITGFIYDAIAYFGADFAVVSDNGKWQKLVF